MRFSAPMVDICDHDLPAALAFYSGRPGLEETFRAPDPDAPDHVELRLDGVTTDGNLVERVMKRSS